MQPLSICVYCGSRDGDRPAFAAVAVAVGTQIGRRGWQLVYGGGRSGLMGRVADAALAAGATVVGVIPVSLMQREVGHTGLTELHVVDTMHQRKLMLAERSDAFIALPGGIGTLEELFETWSWRQLGYHDKPIGLLDVEGCYADLLAFLAKAARHGFMTGFQLGLLEVSSDPLVLLDRLAASARQATAPDDYRAI